MIKSDFKLISIQDIPIDFSKIPGLDTEQIDYVSSIGGATKPEEGADKTSENVAAGFTGQGALATLDAVNAAQIVDGAITTVKIALAAVTADLIAAAAITENKLYTGAVTADKIATNAVTAAKILANTITGDKIAANTITANKMNVSELSAITANIGAITAGTIDGITITGGTIRTSSGTTRCVMDGANNIISIFSSNVERLRLTQDKINFINSDGNTNGRIYTPSTSVFQIEAFNGNYLIMNAAGSLYTIDFQNAGNSIAYISSSGLTLQSGKKITTPEVSATYLTSVNSLRFTSTSSPLTDNGTIYYNGSHFYGRIGGAWYQLD